MGRLFGGRRRAMIRGIHPRRWLATALLVGCAGCKSLFAPHGLPADPLFVHRKPLEVKADSSRPIAVVYSEPSAPANPYFSPERLGAVGSPKSTSGVLTNRPRNEAPEKE